jgi:hypothetical protein
MFSFWWPILVSSNLTEFLHRAPLFVIPQQKPGPPLGLTSISQTTNGFQGSVVDIDAIFKAEIFSDCWCCWALSAAFPRQLYMPSK